jgi:addiction module HigA family antidote
MKQTEKPVHPGALFKKDVLVPHKLSVTAAAALLGVTRAALSEFIHERTALSPRMALRIAKITSDLGSPATTAEGWLAIQAKRTLWELEQRM